MKKPQNIIGRSAVIRVAGENYCGNVLDMAGDRAKRIRIQSPGKRQGDVVMPSEYAFLEWNT